MSYDTLVLDVDNTLYPASWGLMQLISDRMVQFLEQKLRDQDIARLISDYRSRFNSIAVGVYSDFRYEFQDFLHYSHDIDLSNLPAPSSLKQLLENSTFQRRLIFSSAPKRHILNILTKLQLTDAFDDIIAIEDVGYRYKPDAMAFESFYKSTGATPENVVFVDDCPRNISIAKKLGSYAVHIHAHNERAIHSDEGHASLTDFLLNRSKTR